MKTFEVSIYPVTHWTIKVEAKNEQDAINKALSLEGPPEYAFHGDNLEEWEYKIWEWPNIDRNNVDVELVE